VVEDDFGVLDSIADVEVTAPSAGAEKSRPVDQILVEKVTIDEQ
jgi:exonuclease VII large subunit